MADVEIKGRISVDTGAATKTTNDYIDALKAAKKAVNEAKVGSVEYKKAQENLSKATKDLDNAVAKSGGSFSKLKETLGGTVPGFKAAQSGAEGLNTKMWDLVKNPFGAILAAIVLTLVFLYKAFTSTADGGKKLEQVMEGLKAAFQVVTDRVFALGNAVIKFFSGDFTGAINDAKAAVSGIGDEIERVYKQTASITKRLQELKREQYADDVDKAQREKRLAFLREQLNDETVSVNRKIAIAKELRNDQVENAKDDLKRSTEVATLKIKLLEQQKDGAIKNEEEITALKISISRTETENALEGVRTNKVIRNLERQASSEALAAHKADVERKKAIDDEYTKNYLEGIAKRNASEKVAKDELAGIELAGLELLKPVEEEKDRLSQREMERGSLEAQNRDFNRKADEELDNATLQNKWALARAISSIASTLADELGKSTLAGKGLAIAGALIDTYAAIAATLKSAAKTPMGGIPGYAIAQSIATGIAGLLAVKKIASVQVPGKGGGIVSAPSVPSLNTPAPLTPQRTSTALDSSAIQGIGNAANGGVNRSFILESDITNNRERAERINRAARLG